MQRLFCASLLLFLAPAAPLAAQEADFLKPEFVSVHPRAGGDGARAAKYDCTGASCTCTIGKDCRAMFAAVRIVDCRYGEPGMLACEPARK